MNQELIHKYLKGETSSLENQEILNWVETSPENRKEFLRYRRLYDTAIWNETGQLSDNIKKKTVQAVPFIRRWMQVAAIIAIVISGTVFIQQRIFNAEKVLNNPLTVKTNAGERSTILLPDGTEVTLNSKSNIRFDCNYKGGERIVYLEGEGYFNVYPDKKHPFKVKTNMIEVECLGTKFNVKAYEKDEQISVVLAEGSVRIKSDESNVILTPNTCLTYDKDTRYITQSKVNSDDYTHWIKGEVCYNNQKLKDIAEDLSRNFNVNIIIDSKDIENERFTGYLGNTTLKNVLNVLTIASSIEYKFENDTVIYLYNSKKRSYSN